MILCVHIINAPFANKSIASFLHLPSLCRLYSTYYKWELRDRAAGGPGPPTSRITVAHHALLIFCYTALLIWRDMQGWDVSKRSHGGD